MLKEMPKVVLVLIAFLLWLTCFTIGAFGTLALMDFANSTTSKGFPTLQMTASFGGMLIGIMLPAILFYRGLRGGRT